MTNVKLATLDGGGNVPLSQLGNAPGGSGLGWKDVTKSPYNVDNTGATTDTSKIAQALTDANTAGGGVVYLPPGTYKKNYALTVQPGCALVGAGEEATIIVDTTDLGSGNSSITLAEESTAIKHSAADGFTLRGPGYSAWSPGGITAASVPANMSGLRVMSTARARHINAVGYHDGCVVGGNHESIMECRFYGNYYGIYLPGTSIASSFDNHYWYKIESVLNNFAAVGLHADNRITCSDLIACHFGFTPYGIYKENNSLGGVNGPKDILTYNDHLGIWFESVGNGAIYDSTGPTLGVFNNTWGSTYILWNASYRYNTNNHDYAIVCATFKNNIFVDWANPNGSPFGALGFLNIGSGPCWNNQWLGGGQLIINNHAGGLFLVNDSADVQGCNIYTDHGGRASIRKVSGATNPNLNDLVFLATGQGDWAVAKDGSGTGGSDVPIGILQSWGFTSTGAGGAGHWAPVVVEGYAVANTQANIGSNKWIKADTTNRGFVIAGTGQTDAPILGVGRGSSTSTAVIQVTTGAG